MLTYSSVIVLGLDSQLSSVTAFPYICTARAWLLMAGFSLAFGAMFSKTWRVHSIFTDVKLNKKVSFKRRVEIFVSLPLFASPNTQCCKRKRSRTREKKRMNVGKNIIKTYLQKEHVNLVEFPARPCVPILCVRFVTGYQGLSVVHGCRSAAGY